MYVQSNAGLKAQPTEERPRPKSPPSAFGIWVAAGKVRYSLKRWMIHIHKHSITLLHWQVACLPALHLGTFTFSTVFYFQNRGLLWNDTPPVVFQPHTHSWLTHVPWLTPGEPGLSTALPQQNPPALKSSELQASFKTPAPWYSPCAKQRLKNRTWFFSYFQKSGPKGDSCPVICCTVMCMFNATYSLSNNKNLNWVLRLKN